MMPKNKKKIKYRLFACDTSAESVEIILRERFNRITPKYGLVYTKKKFKEWPEITDENVSILSRTDRRWLFECNMVLISEEMGRVEFGVDIQKAIEKLEQALIHEKDLLNNGDGEEGFAGAESG